MTSDQAKWITLQYTRTYSIAAKLSALSRAADMDEMEQFWIGHTDPADLLPPWQKVTLIHRFASWISHSMFLRDCDGPYATFRSSETDFMPKRILPVDAALIRSQLAEDYFRIPPSDGKWIQTRPKRKEWQESEKVANACYTYFTEEVMWSEAYERLSLQIASEVFHVIFNDRATLAGLNELASYRVLDVGETEPDLRYMTHRGRLRRRSPPPWVRRAVFHRDKGTCTACERDLTGLIDPLAAENYDHIIPLALGGLNDVTNMQLTCKGCNQVKAAQLVGPSRRYRRWYRMTPP